MGEQNDKKISVDINALYDDRERLSEALSRIRKSRDGMAAEIEELSGMWEGPSGEVFLRRCRADLSALDELTAVLGGAQESLSYALRQYRECDRDVMSVVTGIKV